jgi:hypothetical protein
VRSSKWKLVTKPGSRVQRFCKNINPGLFVPVLPVVAPVQAVAAPDG